MNKHQVKSIVRKHLIIPIFIAGLFPAIIAIIQKSIFGEGEINPIYVGICTVIACALLIEKVLTEIELLKSKNT